jgi:hypothetical protein
MKKFLVALGLGLVLLHHSNHFSGKLPDHSWWLDADVTINQDGMMHVTQKVSTKECADGFSGLSG